MNTLDEEKWMYEKLWSLFRNTDLREVLDRFGPDAFRRSSALEGFEMFLDAHDFRGHTAVEIGTFRGITACLLARRFTRVVTIDILDDPMKIEIAAALDIHNIAFVTVKDNTEKAELIRAIQFDAAFVDGDHAHDQRDDVALVERCGRVLMHEHWDAQPIVKEVARDLGRRLGGKLTTSDKWALWEAIR